MKRKKFVPHYKREGYNETIQNIPAPEDIERMNRRSILFDGWK